MKTKKYLKKYPEFWDDIKNEIEAINGGKAGYYGKDFMKIKFDADDDLTLNKQVKFPTMAIVTTFAFEDCERLYPQMFLHECFYEL